jgi:nucleoside-diphosphate-sugar epimerase
VRALVTGCAGFIGSHLSESLLTDGHDVVGIDCFNDNYGRASKLDNLKRSQEWDSFEFVPIDLSRGDLLTLIQDVDVVFHLAAEPGVRASWGPRFEHYLRNNVAATQHICEALRLAERPVLVYASSSSIYGQAEHLPTLEDAIPRPLSPYGVTKLAAENLCMLYHANYGVQALSLRYFSVYGPRQRPDMGFSSFCEAALGGSQIRVFGDGRQTRDFTFVGDVVAATRRAAETPGAIGGVFNIGGGHRVSVNDVLDRLADLAGAPLDIVHLPDQHGDARDTGADTSRAREVLDFVPQTTLDEGLAQQFAHHAAMRSRSHAN